MNEREAGFLPPFFTQPETHRMSDKDTRVFMYRGTEARLFNSPEEIPEGEGWKDAPYELEEVAAPVEKKKPSAKKQLKP